MPELHSLFCHGSFNKSGESIFIEVNDMEARIRFSFSAKFQCE